MMRLTTNSLFVLLSLAIAGTHALGDTFGNASNTFDIEFVSIRNPGNATDDDSANPNFAGSVPYIYRIGKFEISEQMIDKANALGGLGITRSNRGPNKPATNVNWNEAARFVNWLNISRGSVPAYKFAIQPGESGYDANADIELWTSSDSGYDPANPLRNTQARYFLPHFNEWYKAAYYDPATEAYFDYPTGSDTAPIAVAGGRTEGTAVYSTVPSGLLAGPADIVDAGGLSPYGTMAQGGNVYEWEESTFFFGESMTNHQVFAEIVGGTGDRLLLVPVVAIFPPQAAFPPFQASRATSLVFASQAVSLNQAHSS
jgi:hypothetical protein